MVPEPATLNRRCATWRRENDFDAMPAIRRARIAAGLTQQDAAKLAGLSRRTLIRSEQPDTRCEAGTLARLALTYGLSADALQAALRE